MWTPYPARRAAAEADSGGHGSGGGAPAAPSAHAPSDGMLTGTFTSERLALILSDEVLTSRLLDDLLARMLAEPAPVRRRPAWNLVPLVPVAHGVFAIATFLLATLAAIAAR